MNILPLFKYSSLYCSLNIPVIKALSHDQDYQHFLNKTERLVLVEISQHGKEENNVTERKTKDEVFNFKS